MKKMISILLAAGLLLCAVLPTVSAESTVPLTADEEQAVFDAWFAFLYEDYIIPFNKYYDSYEEFEADRGERFASEKLSLENVAIECWHKEADIYVVTVIHWNISYIDLFWLESIGDYVFNFSGVNPALYVYADGRLYYLDEAYDAGLISAAALKEIAANYSGVFYEVCRVGDMDRNGRLEVSDVIALRNRIMEGYYPFSSGQISSSFDQYGDMDGDEALTVSDVVALRAAIVAGG